MNKPNGHTAIFVGANSSTDQFKRLFERSADLTEKDWSLVDAEVGEAAIGAIKNPRYANAVLLVSDFQVPGLGHGEVLKIAEDTGHGALRVLSAAGDFTSDADTEWLVRELKTRGIHALYPSLDNAIDVATLMAMGARSFENPSLTSLSILNVDTNDEADFLSGFPDPKIQVVIRLFRYAARRNFIQMVKNKNARSLVTKMEKIVSETILPDHNHEFPLFLG